MNALFRPRNSAVVRSGISAALTSARAASAAAEQVKPKSRLRRERPAAIVMTDKAAERIQMLLDRKPEAIGVRIGVKKRGCNGLSYTMNYADTVPDKDEEIKHNGVRLFIDPAATFFVVGTVMDFEDTPLASEFTFKNPNAKGSCGCGESFNV